MANKPTALRFSPEMMAELRKRQVGRFSYTSYVVTEMLERYLYMIKRARVTIDEQFSENEINYIMHVTSSAAFAAWSVPFLYASIEDYTNFYPQHCMEFAVDGLALAAKVKALPLAETYALVDLLETSSGGETITEGNDIEEEAE